MRKHYKNTKLQCDVGDHGTRKPWVPMCVQENINILLIRNLYTSSKNYVPVFHLY